VADDRITVRLPGGLRDQMRAARGDSNEGEFVVRAFLAALEPDGFADPDAVPAAPRSPSASLPVTADMNAGPPIGWKTLLAPAGGPGLK
jgi:hypothetical protein